MHKEIKIDEEFKNLIPPLKEGELNGLKQSILGEGCRDPLVIWDDILLDGHNRYNICMENGVIFKTVEKNFDNREDAKIWILENQLGRRNLIDAQRIDVVDKLFGLKETQEAKERQIRKPNSVVESLPPQNSGKVRDKLGDKAKVSGRQYAKGIKIKTEDPELWNKCLNGQLSIDAAHKEIKNKNMEAKIAEQKAEIEKGLELPGGLFDVIVIDPPWKYDREYDANASRVASPYPEMSFEELEEIKLPAKDDCILWCWTTHKFIYDAIELLEKWGFEYKCILVWDKEKLGIGSWLRLQTEFCLLGIKGSPVWDKKDLRDIIRAPRTKHSSKPEAFYKMIDNNFIGKKLDYFGRKKRDGWNTYGTGQDSV